MVPLGGQSLEPTALPAAAKAIEVVPNADVKLKYHFVAVGKQIYQCENGAWARASTPDATLYDVNSNLKVRHSAGPSWTMVDSECTVKAIGSTAIHFASPDGVSVDWLKLDVDKARLRPCATSVSSTVFRCSVEFPHTPARQSACSSIRTESRLREPGAFRCFRGGVLGTSLRQVTQPQFRPKCANWSPFGYEPIAAAFTSLRNPPIRLCSVRRPTPRISAARLRLLFTYSRVSLI